jgi:hypothetical protein
MKDAGTWKVPSVCSARRLVSRGLKQHISYCPLNAINVTSGLDPSILLL